MIDRNSVLGIKAESPFLEMPRILPHQCVYLFRLSVSDMLTIHHSILVKEPIKLSRISTIWSCNSRRIIHRLQSLQRTSSSPPLLRRTNPSAFLVLLGSCVVPGNVGYFALLPTKRRRECVTRCCASRSYQSMLRISWQSTMTWGSIRLTERASSFCLRLTPQTVSRSFQMHYHEA